MDKVIENARQVIKKFAMLNGAENVTVALSGGADSVCLLLVMKILSAEYEYKLTAVHVNHLLRGEESDRDEFFCRELCEKEGIPLTVFRADAKEFAKNHKLSLEEGARKLRYGFFDEVCGNNSKLAAAHTLSDNAETVIFNLARGSGLKGLCGIPPKRDKIIRPLIYCTREDIVTFLSERGQSFVTDSSNLSDDYSRNKIRHKVIPVLTELNIGFFESVKRLTESLYEDERFLSEQAEILSESDLRNVDTAVRRRVIKNQLCKNNIEPTGDKILATEKTILGGSGKVCLSGDVYAASKKGRLSIQRIPREREFFPETEVIIGENPFLCDKTVIISLNNDGINAKSVYVNSLVTKSVIDYDKIQGRLSLRNRRNGDGYIRAGRSFTSNLKKLMNESVPQGERDHIAILSDEKGIIWTEKFGIAERVKVTSSTKAFMTIIVKENEYECSRT